MNARLALSDFAPNQLCMHFTKRDIPPLCICQKSKQTQMTHRKYPDKRSQRIIEESTKKRATVKI